VAHHASAKKRIRQTAKRTVRNKHVRSTVRSMIKRVRVAVTGGDAEAARTALATAIKRIDQAVTKGVFHQSTGSRYVSRLSRQVAALSR